MVHSWLIDRMVQRILPKVVADRLGRILAVGPQMLVKV